MMDMQPVNLWNFPLQSKDYIPYQGVIPKKMSFKPQKRRKNDIKNPIYDMRSK